MAKEKTFTVVIPAKQTHPLIVPPGEWKEITSTSLKKAESEAKKIYGNDVIVFGEYKPLSDSLP